VNAKGGTYQGWHLSESTRLEGTPQLGCTSRRLSFRDLGLSGQPSYAATELMPRTGVRQLVPGFSPDFSPPPAGTIFQTPKTKPRGAVRSPG